jgi:Holliday junction resolvase RusA-like endonuclease
MARQFRLDIRDDVGGKGRPRTRIVYSGGKPVAVIYPDPESAKTEKLIKGLAFVKMVGQPMFEGPVELKIEIFLPRPKSWTRKKCASPSGFFATVKPDVDNVAKLIADAFNKTVWTDDTQIADLVVRRRHWDQPPMVTVTVTELELPAKLAAEAPELFRVGATCPAED